MLDKEWVWIADPLDGTTNFVYCLPLSTVSICIAHKVESSSILDFLEDSHYWCDSRPLS